MAGSPFEGFLSTPEMAVAFGQETVVQGMLDLMYADAPDKVLARAVHIHPTVYELLPTLLQGMKPA